MAHAQQYMGMQPFSNSRKIFTPVKIPWWYLKRRKGCRVVRQTDRQTDHTPTNRHYWKQYHLRFATRVLSRSNCSRPGFTERTGINPFMATLKPQSKSPLYSNRVIWYTGRWRVGCYIWYNEEGTGGTVPNVRAHPSTTSVPAVSSCLIIRQVGSNKRKIQIKYKIQNKQTTIKKQSMQRYR